ncbi:MAG: cysteine synthase A [Bacilli bacterium]|nr:cysteine synthase A [Bacilli bacterium]
MKYESSSSLVGNTPLLSCQHLDAKQAHIYAKLECYNPVGSVKDRVALAMIEDAEAKGILKKGSTIIEPTSGNTGIGLAMVGRSKGYEVVLTMPESMSIERRKLLKAYGAKLVLTPAAQGMKGAIAEANRLQQETPNSVILGQFDNPANPKAHYQTTGPEIDRDLEGKVDVFVAGIGTGGTITGVARYLKEKHPHVKIIGVEPAKSPVISGGKPGPHGIMGIGAGFVPSILDTGLIDEMMTIYEEEAYQAAREMGAKEGILVGISSGAALAAALKIASNYPNQNIVVLCPDGGDRYLSTPLFGE